MNVNFDIQRKAGEPTKPPKPVITTKNLDFAYGDSQALFNISMDILKEVTAFIGPSGCGKSTLLRCFNRMNDLINTANIKNGTIRISDIDIYNKDVDVIELRKHVGMVFKNQIRFQNLFMKILPVECVSKG